MTTEERINELSTERAKLYRLASNGRRGDEEIHLRIRELSSQIESLWEQRRQERAGTKEGIDLIIQRAYERTYGRGFEDAVAPRRVTVEEEEEEAAVQAA